MPLFVGTRRILRPVPSTGGGLQPSYVGSGTVEQGTATTVEPAFPASVNSNDIAICWASYITGGSNGITFPGGWTAETGFADSGYGSYSRLAWLRCTGSEDSSTISISFTDLIVGFAQIHIFRDCTTSGTPYEDYTVDLGTGSPIASSTLTATVAPNQAVHQLLDWSSFGGMTPASGWTERFDDYGSSGGSSVTSALYTKDNTAAGDVASTNTTFSGSGGVATISIGFVLKPG